MSSQFAHAGFALFDAAIVPLNDILAVVNDGVSDCCLYAASGEEASRVSPWLLADAAQTRALMDTMRGNPRYAAGATWLGTDVAFDTMARHLRNLGQIHANGKRYYLRYADGRAWADTWSVLGPDQRQAVLGPVKEWDSHAIERCAFRSPSGVDAAASLPLRLTRVQWTNLLRAQRDTHRCIEWLSRQAALASSYSGADLLALARRTGEWLQQLGPLGPEVMRAAGIAALRSGGRVFEEGDAFSQAVRRSSTPSDYEALRSWGSYA
ncbi:DUF4123 domain-containing protein [Luteimonas yindakuii]|uniref:DUF4123 domain-containing protein n=1 Tax=Luteimonas yindakuii TaxID=2565782 RepID=UPI0010A4D2B8|nr:DUF4123 domain-containing protein [Luteimonas yindakuii]QCO67877.1 DUF4123 domain-containing protein [Luteimonas yindakuii]